MLFIADFPPSITEFIPKDCSEAYFWYDAKTNLLWRFQVNLFIGSRQARKTETMRGWWLVAQLSIDDYYGKYKDIREVMGFPPRQTQYLCNT